MGDGSADVVSAELINRVNDWRVPMLVIPGQRDYRIPVSQGISAFTALQRKGIESKFLYFPDENHWVIKPANSILWHDTVNGWLKQHLAPSSQPLSRCPHAPEARRVSLPTGPRSEEQPSKLKSIMRTPDPVFSLNTKK